MGEFEIDGLEEREQIVQVLPKKICERVFSTEFGKFEVKAERGPTGNVAVVCTAIQGSTRQWQKDAAVMKKAFNAHNRSIN
jgi:hypothetical protein